MIIDTGLKAEMERCKGIARAHGLSFRQETLEYSITNREFIELRPKVMVPTLYTHWFDDIEVYSDWKKYLIERHNPFETVINTRPSISFYNEHNPRWMNIMIFYHVLGHIDFFQNNVNFKHTWDDDFRTKALGDKRHIEELRNEHGRWADYAIEWARDIDNLVGNFRAEPPAEGLPQKVQYFFERFLNNKPQQRFDHYLDIYNTQGDEELFTRTKAEFPEFEAIYERHVETRTPPGDDVMQFIIDKSPHLAKRENRWMKDVLGIVRDTSQYFHPQGRTKIMNEGWATYWHEELFSRDPEARGNEQAFSILNSGVVMNLRTGINPYAIGRALFSHIERQMDRGAYSEEYQRILKLHDRKGFDVQTGKGKDLILHVRKNYSDFTFLNEFIDQEFVDRNKLFVVGQRFNAEQGQIEAYVRSKSAEDYKKMVTGMMHHSPRIAVNVERTAKKGVLNLVHHFEGKELYRPMLEGTLVALEQLWGKQVNLLTREYTDRYREYADTMQKGQGWTWYIFNDEGMEPEFQNVVYTCENKNVKKQVMK